MLPGAAMGIPAIARAGGTGQGTNVLRSIVHVIDMRYAVRRHRALAVLCALLALLPVAPRAHAQALDLGSSFVTPFPEKDIYRVVVIGDALAEGMAESLEVSFKGDSSIAISRRTKPKTAIARPDIYDWSKVAETVAAKDQAHIAVVMFGTYEAQPLRNGKKRVALGTSEWADEYGKLVEGILKPLRKAGMAVYWVGIPMMKPAKSAEELQAINGVIRQKVYLSGARFIDIWNSFVDADGRFSQYGPDVTGRMGLLRTDDGVHFTDAGSRKLAHFVEREMRRDVSLAKAERNVPLVGSEAEQRRVSGRPAPAEKSDADVDGRDAAKSGKDQSGGKTARPGAIDPAMQGQKAENARVVLAIASPGAGERPQRVTLDIVRPAIPAQVLSHVTRRADPNKAAAVGESLILETSDGMALLGSISITPEAAGKGRARMPTIQTPQYKVLVKGETLPPREGRADDFRWPRPGAAAGG
jgi:hypothetical protein